MAKIVRKQFLTIPSKLKDGTIVETVEMWSVRAVDDLGNLHLMEFPGVVEPTDQQVLDRLPKLLELNPSKPSDATDFIKARVESWFGLKQVRLEATARLESAAFIALVQGHENAAWVEAKSALEKLRS